MKQALALSRMKVVNLIYEEFHIGSIHLKRKKLVCLLLNITRGVSHSRLAICIKKYLEAKEEELWKLKYFTMQKYNLRKIL